MMMVLHKSDDFQPNRFMLLGFGFETVRVFFSRIEQVLSDVVVAGAQAQCTRLAKTKRRPPDTANNTT